MSYSGRTHIRIAPGVVVFAVTMSLIVLAICLFALNDESALWIIAICWLVWIVSLVAIADVVTAFVRLDDNQIVMRRNLRIRTIPRDDIESVAAAKGCPTLLLLKDGSRIELPDLHVKSMHNSIRAWLRKT